MYHQSSVRFMLCKASASSIQAVKYNKMAIFKGKNRIHFYSNRLKTLILCRFAPIPCRPTAGLEEIGFRIVPLESFKMGARGPGNAVFPLKIAVLCYIPANQGE